MFELNSSTLFIAIIVPLTSLFFMWRKRRTTFCQHSTNLHGQIAIVTGANVGIGKETARELAKRGARVILACRNVEKGQAAADDIRKTVNDAEVIVRQVDLSSMKNVKEFAELIAREERCIDILINNAGVASPVDSVTVDGFETTIATNHLGPFLLTLLLIDLLEKSQSKRIVTVASLLDFGNRVEFDNNGELIQQSAAPPQLYANTKLMNYLFTYELSHRFHSRGISTFSVMPGFVNTSISRNFLNNGPLIILKPLVNLFMWMNKTPVEGCQTVVYCAVAPDIERFSGEHFRECRVQKLSEKVKDKRLAEMLWRYSEAQVKAFM